jgi:hypothetical protein
MAMLIPAGSKSWRIGYPLVCGNEVDSTTNRGSLRASYFLQNPLDRVSGPEADRMARIPTEEMERLMA